MTFLRSLGAVGFGVTFFVSGTIIAVLQLLCLLVKPFNLQLYRTINHYLCYGLYVQLACLLDWWSGTETIVYTDIEDYKKYFGKEHALCIANHTYELDWMVIPALQESLKLLGTHKCFSKKFLKFVPPVGWTLYLSENVFLERNFEKDKKIIQKQVANLADYKDPMWVIMYAEGTRFTPEKQKASVEFSKSKDLPQLKHHLQPRTKGFVATLTPMRGKVPAIYDFLVAVKTDGPNTIQPTLKNILYGKPVTCHVYINRIPLESIPMDEQEQEKFLRDLFVKKDKMKESFVNTGDFFKTSGVKKTDSFKRKKRIYPVLCEAMWILSLMGSTIYFLIRNILSGNLMSSGITIAILAVVFILLHMAIGLLQAQSSYGKTKNKSS